MKIQNIRLFLGLMASALCLFSTGCTTTSLANKLKEFEALGITEVQITGKFSSTSYKVEEKEGRRRAELDHTNAWLPKVRIVRDTAAPTH